MEVITVDSMSAYLNACRAHWRFNNRRNVFFRGQSNEQWPLVPGCAREPHNIHDDEALFHEWLSKSGERLGINEYYAKRPLLLLTIAQHYGLPTRLLDWSFSPLVALYFACRTGHDTDAAVYLYKRDKHTPYNVNGMKSHNDSIEIGGMDYDMVFMLSPRTSDRMESQLGLFSLHAKPGKPFEECMQPNDKLVKIVIPANLKTFVLIELDFMGIRASTIFAGDDGAAQEIKETNELIGRIDKMDPKLFDF